jgi:hypothetical protein
MHLNPCGAKCEIMRRTYRTLIKPFADSEETVGIRWYRTHDDAPTLPFPSFVTSRDWREDHTTPTPLGEVWDAPRTFYRGDPIPGANGQHVCGTEEEFWNGQKYDPAAPPTVYHPSGIPICCDGNAASGVAVDVWPSAVVRTPQNVTGQTGVTVWPSAVVSPGNARVTGRTGVYVRPGASVWADYGVTGGTGVEVWPSAVVTAGGVVEGGGILNPETGPCGWGVNAELDVIYEFQLGTPNQYNWAWILEPGLYCLQVRAEFSSAASDVQAWRGPDCASIEPFPFATTVAGGGLPWTSTGVVDTPPIPNLPHWWHRTFTVEEETFVYVAITPDDLGGVYRVRITKDAPCYIPPPLDPFPN